MVYSVKAISLEAVDLFDFREFINIFVSNVYDHVYNSLVY